LPAYVWGPQNLRSKSIGKRQEGKKRAKSVNVTDLDPRVDHA